jgi:hypothetical protein
VDYEFRIEDSLYTVVLEAKGEGYLVTSGEASFEAEVHPISPNALSVPASGVLRGAAF